MPITKPIISKDNLDEKVEKGQTWASKAESVSTDQQRGSSPGASPPRENVNVKDPVNEKARAQVRAKAQAKVKVTVNVNSKQAGAKVKIKLKVSLETHVEFFYTTINKT